MKKSNYYYYGKKSKIADIRSFYALRARKRIYKLFMDVNRPKETDLIVDVGVSPDTEFAESNFFEKFYPYKSNLTATSIEDARDLEKLYPGLRFVQTQPYNLPFDDQHFDFLFCNAVIEHVGSNAMQRKFIAECIRVSKRFFFTTPNRWFPVEMHSILPLLHWLPCRVFRRILYILGKKELSKEENLNLLSCKKALSLFPPDAKIRLIKIRTLGFVSNIVICGG